MVLDGSNDTDIELNSEGISICMTPFTKETIGEHFIIDFNQNYGFVLKTPNEVLAFGLKVK
ncbi:hypothetical protein HNQ94_000816 [Salirhabdus euzebyi]|uniref:Uncharacterized protein n=1 Tax=Salirhabdus euzebyi TaxID=394506 RepID=A0A841PYY1_9BACI|nr:hypothetical protein [Salirhabdus euzebyi]